ncbi:MAG: TIR domain-containing protein [Sphingomonas sp.]
MVDDIRAAGRYAAFISYSHKDAAAARRLHARLERYRIPKRLVGTLGEHGPVPARLTPLFRDRDDLPAAGDLSEKVRAALAAADHLVVLCSPNAVASPWVAREIRAFRELHPGHPVLAAVIEGEPGDCFPSGLGGTDDDGAVIEPLAADLRRVGDGQRLGFLKLVAGLTGVDLDALVQRDAARQIRRVTAVTLVAVTAMLVMAMLTILAIDARHEAVRQRIEAERQRGEAEGMVEFMRTDLRDRLKGVGRIDVLIAANQRALDYYAHQNLKTLSPDSLERRAAILHAMGEDDETLGHLDHAQAQFEEAGRTTAALLAADPTNPDRIFAQSQSEFWVGSVAYNRSDYSAAKRYFQRYKALTDRLLTIDPRKPAWLKEAAFAEGNLCSTALAKPADVPGAMVACRNALDRMEAAAHRASDPRSYRKDIANRLGWLADAQRAAGDLPGALAQRRRQLEIVEAQLTEDPANARLKANRAWALRAIADLEGQLGQIEPGIAHLTAAEQTLSELVRLDPSNEDWGPRLGAVHKELETMRSKRR